MYWTALVGADGIVYFYEDVYDRDARVFEGLRAALGVDLPTQTGS